MAKKKKSDEGGGGGSPAWMATFSDLMNLLLCFFVLLFAMSSIDVEKFEEIAASFRQSYSIFDGGAASITEGSLISSGVSQLSDLSDYFSEMGANPETEEEADTLEAYEEQMEQQKLEASEEIAEDVENQLNLMGISDKVDMEVETQYVSLTLNGALLFDPGSVIIKNEAYEFIEKIGTILKTYKQNEIWIIGHTDSIPVVKNSIKYEDNMELSEGRAYSVYKFLRDRLNLNMKNIGCIGRGEQEPVASNETAEGRSLNRRVEIKIFNEYASTP